VKPSRAGGVDGGVAGSCMNRALFKIAFFLQSDHGSLPSADHRPRIMINHPIRDRRLSETDISRGQHPRMTDHSQSSRKTKADDHCRRCQRTRTAL
jgi:hypothetical protein